MSRNRDYRERDDRGDRGDRDRDYRERDDRRDRDYQERDGRGDRDHRDRDDRGDRDYQERDSGRGSDRGHRDRDHQERDGRGGDRDDRERSRRDDERDSAPRQTPRSEYRDTRDAEPRRRSRSPDRGRGDEPSQRPSKWGQGAPPTGGEGGEKREQPPDWLADLIGVPGVSASSEQGAYEQPLNCKTLMIPSELRGGLIGKAGSIINEIRGKSQCIIQINQSAPDDAMFSLQITGNVALAEKMINDRVEELQRPQKRWEEENAPPDKNAWLVEKLTAEGCPPERIAQLLALANKNKKPAAPGPASGVQTAGYGTSGVLAGGARTWKNPNDWNCPQCMDIQFAGRMECRKCGCAKPGGLKPGEGPVKGNPNDWFCPNCNDLQFARNALCRKCGNPNPSKNAP